MADPVTLATIGVGSAVAGGGIKAFGDWFSGQAQSNQANYQAGVARANAQLAKQDAIYATRIGEVEAQQAGMRGRAQVGRTRVGYGAGNVSAATGSPAKVITSETAITQANEATLRANAAKRAYGFDVAAAQDTAQGRLFDTAASTARTSGDINIASTIVGTVGNVANKWIEAGQFGIIPDNTNNPTRLGALY